MIGAISLVQFNNPSFTGRKVPNFGFPCDSFCYSDGYKFIKKIFNFAPQNAEKLEVYRGPKNLEAGFSTEDLQDVGGGWLKADCQTPLSTTGVRTCAVLNLVNEETFENILYHVHDETSAGKIEKFIKEKFPEFTRVNIVGGDQFKTSNTMRKIVQAVDNINPNADKTFYYTVTENPEIVAYQGDMYYMKGNSGKVSFVQNTKNYWY